MIAPGSSRRRRPNSSSDNDSSTVRPFRTYINASRIEVRAENADSIPRAERRDTTDLMADRYASTAAWSVLDNWANPAIVPNPTNAIVMLARLLRFILFVRLTARFQRRRLMIPSAAVRSNRVRRRVSKLESTIDDSS